MFATNPFSILAETVPSIVMQGFVVLMVLLIVAGTLLDIIHKKNVKYFSLLFCLSSVIKLLSILFSYL